MAFSFKIMPPPPRKHLKDLLSEDQEPFHLHSFIADRRRHLLLHEKPPPRPQSFQHLAKSKPTLIPKTPSFHHKNPCFFSSSSSSPSSTDSPLIHFSSSPSLTASLGRSPRRASTPGLLFLHVPPMPAAATRIQKHRSNSKQPESHTNNYPCFGVLGSMLKRLTTRKRALIGENDSAGTGVCARGLVGRWSVNLDRSENDGGGGCTLLQPVQVESAETVQVGRENGEFEFCLSPFRFAPQSCGVGSPGRRSPCFGSPPTHHPSRELLEDNSFRDPASTVINQLEDDEEYKDQNSPVSVLGRPFKDDDDGRGPQGDEHGKRISGAFVQSKCHGKRISGAFVQSGGKKMRESGQLELEGKFLEEEEDDEHTNESGGDSSTSSLIKDVLVLSSIDLMMSVDLRRESDDWRKHREQVAQVVTDIEVDIFVVLVEELVDDVLI